jgi:DNA mismatch repair ATPase MutS
MKIYHDHVQRYSADVLRLGNELKQLSTLRLIVFVLSIILLVYLANERLTAAVLIAAPICAVVFAALVTRYNKIERLKLRAASLKKINEKEMLRQDNKLSDFSTGDEYLDRGHSNTADLDIFGQHSLFQLVNRTTTKSGEALLADWLSAPASTSTVMERQQAIKELAPKFGWRQYFEASGIGLRPEDRDYRELVAWMEKPPLFLARQVRYLLIVIPLSVLSTLALVYFIKQFILPSNVQNDDPLITSMLVKSIAPLIITMLINALVLQNIKPIAEEILENIQRDIKILNTYYALISHADLETFESQALKGLQLSMRTANHSAAIEIQKLKKVFELFKLRGRKRELNHQFYAAFNNLWFLDVYMIIKTESWKRRNGQLVSGWIAAVSELEALTSLAGFSYANPEYTFPVITEKSNCIQFSKVGHPLIDADRRVYNDFEQAGNGQVSMITGSNMAGKSTFLRTVGINIVLALAGAPCCAAHSKISNLRVFTSMRTQDNLEEGVSSFYAELNRIEQLLRLIQNRQPIVFLLDEMFKGTNSKDRHRGGYSLIVQLKELQAFGIISTHDLDLAMLAGERGMVSNYSFNSSIHGGEMNFNYLLTEGLCSDFNASELMKRSGIKVLSDI